MRQGSLDLGSPDGHAPSPAPSGPVDAGAVTPPPTAPFASLRVRNFGRFAAADFPLAPFTVFWGPNEAGKTTLFDACLAAMSQITRKNPIMQRYQADGEAQLQRADGAPTRKMDQHLVTSVLAARAGALAIAFDEGKDWQKTVKNRLLSHGVDPLVLAQRCAKKAPGTKVRGETDAEMARADAARARWAAERRALAERRAQWESQAAAWRQAKERWEADRRALDGAETRKKAQADRERALRLESLLADVAAWEAAVQRLRETEAWERMDAVRYAALATAREDALRALRDAEAVAASARSQAEAAREEPRGKNVTAGAEAAAGSPTLAAAIVAAGTLGILTAVLWGVSGPDSTFLPAALGLMGLAALGWGLRLMLRLARRRAADEAAKRAADAWLARAQEAWRDAEAKASRAAADAASVDAEWQALAKACGIADPHAWPQLMAERRRTRDEAAASEAKLKALCQGRDILTQKALWFAEWQSLRASHAPEASSSSGAPSPLHGNGAEPSDHGSGAKSRTWTDASSVTATRNPAPATSRPSHGGEDSRAAGARSSFDAAAEAQRLAEAARGLANQEVALSEGKGRWLSDEARVAEGESEAQAAWATASQAREALRRDEQAWQMAKDIFEGMAANEDDRFADLTRRIAARLPHEGPGPRMPRMDRFKEDAIMVPDRLGQMTRLRNLSTGTQDLFLLAARLVLAELADPPQRVLLLDEPFVAMDAARTRRALAMVAESLANGWQILLFTKDEALAHAVTEYGALVHRLEGQGA